jgi:large repetitive protein
MLRYRFPSLRTGLVGHWSPSRSGPTGSRLLDFSGAGNHGELQSMTNDNWVVSGTGYALNFDGVNDYVRIPHSSSLDFSTAFTLSAWVNPNSPTASYGAIISKPTNFVGNPYNMYGLQGWAAIPSPPRMVLGNSGAEFTLSATTVLNGWRHVACTFDRGAAAIYVGGRRENSFTFGFSAVTQNTQPLGIGGVDRAGIADLARAAIDDVRLFPRPLTPEEIFWLALGRGDQFVRTYSVRVGFEPDGGGSQATATIVEGADALTATASVPIQSTATIVEGADALTATASVAISGSATIVEGPDALTATASVRIQSTATIVEGPDALTATANSGGGYSAGATIVEGADALTATASVRIQSTATIVEGADALTATATSRIQSTATIVDGPDALTATASVRIQSTATIVDGADVLTATATAGSSSAQQFDMNPFLDAEFSTLEVC